MSPILIEISPGELTDRISILEIKSERISDPQKLEHVRRELAALLKVRDRDMSLSAAADEMARELRQVNEALWETEEQLRRLESAGTFGHQFIALARSV